MTLFVGKALAHKMLGDFRTGNIKHRCRQVYERNKVADLAAAREAAARYYKRNFNACLMA